MARTSVRLEITSLGHTKSSPALEWRVIDYTWLVTLDTLTGVVVDALGSNVGRAPLSLCLSDTRTFAARFPFFDGIFSVWPQRFL